MSKTTKPTEAKATPASTPAHFADLFAYYADRLGEITRRCAARQDDPAIRGDYMLWRPLVAKWRGLALEDLPDCPNLPDPPDLIGNDFFGAMVRLAEYCQRAADRLRNPQATGAENTPGLPADIPDDATLSASVLADRYGLRAEAVRKRLERHRQHDLTCFVENTERAANEPRFLYRMGSVRGLLATMKASGRASGERPAEKQ